MWVETTYPNCPGRSGIAPLHVPDPSRLRTNGKLTAAASVTVVVASSPRTFHSVSTD